MDPKKPCVATPTVGLPPTGLRTGLEHVLGSRSEKRVTERVTHVTHAFS